MKMYLMQYTDSKFYRETANLCPTIDVQPAKTRLTNQ